VVPIVWLFRLPGRTPSGVSSSPPIHVMTRQSHDPKTPDDWKLPTPSRFCGKAGKSATLALCRGSQPLAKLASITSPLPHQDSDGCQVSRWRGGQLQCRGGIVHGDQPTGLQGNVIRDYSPPIYYHVDWRSFPQPLLSLGDRRHSKAWDHWAYRIRLRGCSPSLKLNGTGQRASLSGASETRERQTCDEFSGASGTRAAVAPTHCEQPTRARARGLHEPSGECGQALPRARSHSKG